jgi:hypothetical protein
MQVLRRWLAVAGLGLATLLVASNAQASIDTLRFKTTFAFDVGKAKLPAGTYEIRRVGMNPQVLEVSNALTGRRMALFTVQNGPISRWSMPLPYDAGLTFERSSDRGPFVLTRLWDLGMGTDAITNAEVPRVEPSPTHHAAANHSPATHQRHVTVRAQHRDGGTAK